jgi:stage IV sporulation protein FB
MAAASGEKGMKRFAQGYLLLGRVQRIPIRLHWTAPLGAILFGRFRFVPAFWGAFLALVLIHELGHAAMVRMARARVTMIDLDGAGGLCHWRGSVSPMREALIAWGGIFGQLVALAVTYALVFAFGRPENEYVAQIVDVFTRANLWLAAFNLIPVRHLDGAKAWKIVPLLYRAAKARMARGAKRRDVLRAAKQEVAQIEKLDEASDDVAAKVDDVLSKLTSEVNKSAKKEPSE